MKAFAMSMAIILAGFAFGARAGSVHQVPGEFSTIQEAIVASADGDTVLVAPGTYFERIDFLDRQISVRSSDGPAATIIDGTFLGPVVHFGPSSTREATIEGFTITHGKGNTFAGGVEVDQGSPSIVGNIVSDNLGEGFGNGISLYFSSGLVMGNQILDNANASDMFGGGGGGGIGIGGTPCFDIGCGAEIRNNLIEGNSADNFTSGGGIYANGGGMVKIIDNVIRNNSALSQGAGIAMGNDVDAQIENNLIVGNYLLQQDSQGGGVYWLAASRGPFLVGNTLVDNQAAHGSGIYADGNDEASRIINNTIRGVPGVTAVECGDFDHVFPMVRSNNVYVEDAPAYAGLCAGAAGVDGNISEAPIFAGNDDYRLAPGSPGIDAGENVFATELFDLQGLPRIIDGNGDGVATIDLGAYELQDEIFSDSFDQ